MTTMLDYALSYTKLGMAVFPILPKGKKPLTEHGFKDASKDQKQVRSWWRKWPDANIGVATGQVSGGIYVIDLDVDDDKGTDGYHEFEDWQRDNVHFPDSWMVITGRGGYHVYFKTDKKVQNRAGILDGVDIRGDGGYVVAPPSVHPNGNSYEWEYGPEDIPIATADEQLKKFTARKKKYQRPDENFKLPDIIPKGQRNDILFKEACSLQTKGVPDDVIMFSVKAVNEARCESSLPEDEVERIVNSALKYDKGAKHLPADVDPVDHDAPILREGERGPFQITQNVIEVLEHDSKLRGAICYNELAYAPSVRGSLPWDESGITREWNNFDDANLYNYVESEYGLNNRTKIAEALDIVMNRHRFNPVRDLLEILYTNWDKSTGHIENLLPNYMGVEKNEYSIECMKLFMLGAITRAYHPGAKFDYMPVLVGKQGIGKSTFFRYLAMDDGWYNDNFNTVEGDKAAEKLRGMWMVEMAELLATKRAKEIESIKSFLTSTSDNYRQPYARRSEQRPRMCVFAGTTNSDSFLTDRTGNRRFLPLVARESHIQKSLFENEDSITADFAAAWGEAMDLYKKAHGRPKLTLSHEAAKMAVEEQARFTEDDSRAGIIQNWLSNTENTRVCACMIWQEALGFLNPPSRKDSNEIIAIMSNEISGWDRMEKKAKCGKYGTTICFEKKVDNNCLAAEKDDEPFIELPENVDLPFD